MCSSDLGLRFYWGSSKDQTSKTGSGTGPCGLSMSTQLDDHLWTNTIGTQLWMHSNTPSRTLAPEKGQKTNSVNSHSLLMWLTSSLPNSNHWLTKQPIAWMINRPYPCSHPNSHTRWWTISTRWSGQEPLPNGQKQYDVITRTTPLSITSEVSTKTPQRKNSNRRKDSRQNN